jgi:hypothetical protein
MFAFSSALGSIVSALYLFASIYVYTSLIRQIAARRSTSAPASTSRFALAEAILAVALISLLLLNVLAAFSRKAPAQLSTRDLVANFVVTLGIVLFVVAFLKLRGFDLNSLAGFSKMSFLRVLGIAAVLLVAAGPLLFLAETIAQRAFGGGSSRQEIVDLFNSSQTLQQRVLIIVLAVAVAQVAKEFICRLFVYGVMKR